MYVLITYLFINFSYNGNMPTAPRGQNFPNHHHQLRRAVKKVPPRLLNQVRCVITVQNSITNYIEVIAKSWLDTCILLLFIY